MDQSQVHKLDKDDCKRIKYEEDYLKKLSEKLQQTNFPKEETNEELDSRIKYHEEITFQVLEAIDYLKEREPFWHYFN